MFPSDEEISHAKWLEARGILTTEKIESFKERVLNVMDKQIDIEEHCDALMRAASLAHYGLLGSVKNMTLTDVYLRDIPAKHLASLTSCVTRYLHIENVSSCDLVSILTSVKCQRLGIYSLGREETKALVQAMESGVEEVELRCEVTLDIEALAEYSGQGVCRRVKILSETLVEERLYQTLKEKLGWAHNINWRFEEEETSNPYPGNYSISVYSISRTDARELQSSKFFSIWTGLFPLFDDEDP